MSQIITPNRPAPGVLVTPGGVPIVPDYLKQRMAALSDRISIEWIAGVHKPYFGLKVRWRNGDPRWEHVREGRMPASAAFDLEKMFPSDCPMSDIAAYVEAHWGDRNAMTAADAAKEADRIVTEAVVRQQQAKNAQVDTLVERGTQQHLSESDHLRRVRAGAESAHPMVSGGLVT